MKKDPRLSCQHDATSRGICGGRRKRREKMLDASEIRLLMLHFLLQNSAHGYELIKSIEDLSKGEYSPSPGIIYPNLTLLEEMDAIRVVDAQASRKAYALNEVGRQLVIEHQQHIALLTERLSSLAVLVTNRSIPDVDQAIHRIRTVLNARLSQRDITAEEIQRVIDALNFASDEITNI